MVDPTGPAARPPKSVLRVVSLPGHADAPRSHAALLARSLGLGLRSLSRSELAALPDCPVRDDDGHGTTDRFPIDLLAWARGPLLIGPGMPADGRGRHSKATRDRGARGTGEHAITAVLPVEGGQAPSETLHDVFSCFIDAGIDLFVLHVFDDSTRPVFWEGPGHHDTAWRREFTRRYFDDDAMDLHVRRGAASREIADFAVATEADVVVLEWSGSDGADRCRTIRSLATVSPSSLLVVPAGWRFTGAGSSAGTRVKVATTSGP